MPKEANMTLISIPIEDKKKFKKLAKRDGRTMRALFKIMLNTYDNATNIKKGGKNG